MTSAFITLGNLAAFQTGLVQTNTISFMKIKFFSSDRRDAGGVVSKVVGLNPGLNRPPCVV